MRCTGGRSGTDILLNTEVLTYSRSNGIFAGITLAGAVVEPDKDSTGAIYGREPSFHAILSGRVHAPASTENFMRAVAETAHTSAVAEASPEQK